jgi:pimeloyl-ACP methyl ester carboxylesterase
MPKLDRPDGAEIHWDEEGKGPAVLIANILHGHPGMVAGLAVDLSSDHRVITYDLRGTAASSRRGTGPRGDGVGPGDVRARRGSGSPQ